MSNSHLNLAKHNTEFYKELCQKFPNQYHDWKVTVIFYTALHLIEALAEHKNIDIGITHHERDNHLNPDKKNNMPVRRSVYLDYQLLKRNSEDCRYEAPVKIEVYQNFLSTDLTNNYRALQRIALYVESLSELKLDFVLAA